MPVAPMRSSGFRPILSMSDIATMVATMLVTLVIVLIRNESFGREADRLPQRG